MRISRFQMILCCFIGLGFGFEEIAQAGAGNGKRIVNRTVQMAPSPAPDSSKQEAPEASASPSPDSSSQRAMPGSGRRIVN